MKHDLDAIGCCRNCWASREELEDQEIGDECQCPDGQQGQAVSVYDWGLGYRRQAFQEDITKMEEFIASLSALVSPNPFPAIDASEDFDFELAVFQNPQRSDCVFVAENKEIEAYPGVRNLDGRPCYPSTPATKFKIGIGISPGFAAEIVRRWNAYKPS